MSAPVGPPPSPSGLFDPNKRDPPTWPDPKRRRPRPQIDKDKRKAAFAAMSHPHDAALHAVLGEAGKDSRGCELRRNQFTSEKGASKTAEVAAAPTTAVITAVAQAKEMSIPKLYRRVSNAELNPWLQTPPPRRTRLRNLRRLLVWKAGNAGAYGVTAEASEV